MRKHRFLPLLLCMLAGLLMAGPYGTSRLAHKDSSGFLVLFVGPFVGAIVYLAVTRAQRMRTIPQKQISD
jgi:hypothetical protein